MLVRRLDDVVQEDVKVMSGATPVGLHNEACTGLFELVAVLRLCLALLRGAARRAQVRSSSEDDD